jgi:ribosomal protein S3
MKQKLYFYIYNVLHVRCYGALCVIVSIFLGEALEDEDFEEEEEEGEEGEEEDDDEDPEFNPRNKHAVAVPKNVNPADCKQQ